MFAVLISMLTKQDIESELSYAYLHALASKAGFVCESRPRHIDNDGVDATVSALGTKLCAKSEIYTLSIDIQLKATKRQLTREQGFISYKLKTKHFEKLKNTNIQSPRFLVVLQLPELERFWLECTPHSLLMRLTAYWLRLRNAPDTLNRSNVTVKIPESNVLTVASLRKLMKLTSCLEYIDYA